ncbi:MAG: FAD-dependent oxidoreductase, partial [Pseudomonadota bacterium]
MADSRYEVVIVGAGIAGIATAFYLVTRYGRRSVLLIDSREPMSYTSAQSGDNYRNWWPHPTMAAFTNDSIDELDRLALESDNVFHMTRGGYALATRHDVSGFVQTIAGDIDVHLTEGKSAVAKRFPAFSDEIANVIHIRRGGDISGQQLGAWMLDRVRAGGGRRIVGDVRSINENGGYDIEFVTSEGIRKVSGDAVVNAAGPFVNNIAAMLGQTLPVKNVFQQKIAFEDTRGAIPRDMPFSIDLDAKTLQWSADEIELLREDDEHAWLTEEIQGGTHCRPEGGLNGGWVKLGWAYNQTPSEPQQDLADEPSIDPQFPEIVIRGAAAFLPKLQQYIEAPPTRFAHYGGYYTMTGENWPIIGPLDDRAA